MYLWSQHIILQHHYSHVPSYVLSSFKDGGRVTSEITSDTNAGPQLVIWGTDVIVDQCKKKFKRFIETYVEVAVDQDERFDGINPNEPLYMQRLEEVFNHESF